MKNFRRNTILLSVGVSLFALGCFVFMIRLSFFQKEKYSGSPTIYKEYNESQIPNLTKDELLNCVIVSPVTPSRGVIYDDMDKPLVSNVRVYPIYIDGQSYNKNNLFFKKGESYLDTLINDLAIQFQTIFGERYTQYNVTTYRDKLTKALKNNKTVTIFREDEVIRDNQWVVESDIKRLKELPLLSGTIKPEVRARYGFKIEQKIKFPDVIDEGDKVISIRIRPYGDMAKRILGDPQRKNGIDGCSQFNKILSGSAGVKKRLIINGISIPLESENPPVEGGNVYTTLNTEIQKIVHIELLKKTEMLKPDWACAIVMETATGDIKAISNFTRTISGQDTIYTESRNNAMVAEAVEPGSTFKVASLLAYLERMNGDTTRKYPINIHSFNTRGSRIVTRYDSEQAAAKGEQQASVKEIIQRSSNVGMASMIRDAYPNYKEYVQKLNRMYITVGNTVQIGKLPPVNMKYDSKSFEDQYGCYFGAGFYMQPLQILVYYNAVANNGKMMRPRFIRASKVEGKVTEYPVSVINEQIASPQNIKIVQSILRSVVMERPGTAYGCHDDDFPFAGKTGTRDIYDVAAGGYNRSRNAISFCGYFPADKPQYTCIVYMFNVAEHSRPAIEVFASIARQIIYPPKQIEKIEKLFTFSHPIKSSTVKNIAKLFEIPVSSVGNSNYSISSRKEKNTIVPYTVQEQNNIPNLIGLTAPDAIAELSKKRIKVSLFGIGVVSKQVYDKNSNTMILNLEPG
ncbi:MAG: penicillin-binding transpeptidase domain-containing protein [Bacteroidales bacterium]|jgi:cell division protein FtsI (penicillin-binding protein 3)|nr:penicillin-binding transpeptidase domain-containing protein [Bacteroidales bacterium]